MAVGWLQLIGLPFVGIVIGKAIDISITAYIDKRKQIRDKADRLLEYIIEYGELIELYRFYLTDSRRTLDNGTVEKVILEPEPRYREAIKRSKGVSLEEAIIDKIVKIRLAAPEEDVLSIDIDRTGDLNNQLKQLYIKCKISPDSILNIMKRLNKDDISSEFFNMMQQTITEATQQYRQVRIYIDQYRFIDLLHYFRFRYLGQRLH